jgi:hypothetical protein
MTDAESADALAIVRLFDFNDKRELENYARNLVVTRRALVRVVEACEAGILPYAHAIHTRDYVPSHLWPSASEKLALVENGVGDLKADAVKAVNKIAQTFRDRRLLVGHIFLGPERKRWHFLYLDQRDIAERDNHWREGPHVHFLNWLWHGRDPQTVWNEFQAGDAPPGALHIRFDYQRRPQPDDFIPSGDA